MIPGCEVKAGVCLVGVQPVMSRAAMKVADVYKKFGRSCVITSGVEGKHSANSLHYEGLALDFRTRHLLETKHLALRQAVSEALGDDFDVVLERTHLHVEYDPA